MLANLTVSILDTDFYALQAITSYLALDRRTRVVHTAETQEDLFDYLQHASIAELPNVILFDADHMGTPKGLREFLKRLHQCAPQAIVICLAQVTDLNLIQAAAQAGARGYFLKGDLRLQISWAILFALENDFVVTRSVQASIADLFEGRLFRATVLPEPRTYPELTDRIRQAIQLCVVEGMPAQLAADEMGISPHTVRSYIKEGYRILEAYNDLEFPVDMTAQERAFYRFTMPEGWRGSLERRKAS
ncbi:MAG: response regulator transcription factor [Anaerolineae bacterium]|nr:response regulator transcription factor [Anaerolineae bacterium]